MQNVSKRAWLTLVAALLLPLVPIMIVPFFDTSEPRYAEIARVMAETGDWITPWFSPGVPFWGKPPLSFWAQAFSMRWLGYTEFAARLPAWICLLLSNGALVLGLAFIKGPRLAILTSIIYSTCALVYISSGAVLTDPFLALGTTLSLISFAVLASSPRLSRIESKQAQTGHTPKYTALIFWRYAFFLGLVIGLLAKGPLAAVLIFAPVLIWRVCNWKTSSLSVLPWLKGFALTAALSLPWYILAEIKTPGFLDYFLIGEHIRRFLDPGWAGDLYGSAHQRTYGTIWLYWLMATFPWGLIALATGAGALRSPRIRSILKNFRKDPLLVYWLAAALFTPLFFTFSANILWTYLLPSLAGACVLIAVFLDQVAEQFNTTRPFILHKVAAIVPSCVLVFSIIVGVNPNLRNTERGLVQYVMHTQQPSLPLLYFSKPPFSAQFYSAGQAQTVTADTLKKEAETVAPFYLAIPKAQQQEAARLLGQPLAPLYTNKRYVLVKVLHLENLAKTPNTCPDINKPCLL